MGRGIKILLGLVLFFFLFLIFSTNNTSKKIDWRQTYLRKHKIPYGTYIIFNELSTMLPNTKVKVVNISPYEFLKNNTKKGTYILVNKNIKIEKEELEQMKKFVSKGNNILISSHNIAFDSLGFTTNYFVANAFNTSKYVQLTNSAFGNNKYFFNRSFTPNTFDKIDTLNSTVLGRLAYENDTSHNPKDINFVKFRYGNGNFLFHTFPEAFTNNFILDSINNEYTSGILSYMDQPETIFWDAYYKAGRAKRSSPLHFIFSNESLKWAYLSLIFGVLIFIVFEGKRKQKIIPIVKPEKNMSLQFARTIANMYYKTSNHKKIAELMINFFKENIRTKYLLDTQIINARFVTDLAAKTNKTEEEISKTFKIFDRLHSKTIVTKEELIDLEILIESYKNN